MSINILEGQDVDCISPFPQSQLGSAASWMRCYKTLIFGDDGPQTDEDIEEFLRARLPLMRSWAVVDKGNLTGAKRNDVPLVGIIVFEPINKFNGYAHIASSRRAWGEKLAKPGLIEQGCKLAIADVFQNLPELQRVSVATFAKNAAAKALAQRLGFHKDGYFRAMGRERGVPQDVVHFGLVREQDLAKEVGV